MALRLLAEIRLTLLAVWRGVVGVYKSDDLTFAASIAYYALLSLFPFFLLVFSILGSVTSNPADRAAILEFILRYFPRQFEFVTTQLYSPHPPPPPFSMPGTSCVRWPARCAFGLL